MNSREQWYAGDLVQTMVVGEPFQELAKYLGCTEVEKIHFDDIDYELEEILDDDIEDLECDFVNYFEIIKGLVDQGLISDEQITKYHLDFALDNGGGSDDSYEEFPKRPVIDLQKLRGHIGKKWKYNKNLYIEKQYIRWKPQKTIDSRSYLLSMYQSSNNPSKCFCQKCKRVIPLRYIERNDIEKNPVYAWEQMYLSLCLNCSKDYILLRNNDIIWERFVREIMRANVLSGGVIDVPIGSDGIFFTATHLAEVQEIFKNEGWGANAPKRRPKLGTSADDEE